jgi:hypothetical protein
MNQAEEILSKHHDVLDRLATALLEEETIEGEDLEAIFSGTAADDGVVVPMPRYRGRPALASLGGLPRLASGLASTVTDES